MYSNERMGQYVPSNTDGQGSVVYGSSGNSGLSIPSDIGKFDSSNQGDLSGDKRGVRCSLVNDTSPLLTHSLNTSYDNHRNYVAQELVEQERGFFKDHNRIPNKGNENQAVKKIEKAMSFKKIRDTAALIELKSLFVASVPLSITFLLQCSLSTVSVFTAGHLGSVELAGVSIGSMTASISGYAIIQGISSALDTLCPQAFGAKEYYLVGTYLQKCVAMNFTIMVPILFIWTFFGYEVIRGFLPDNDTARYAAVYVRYTAPGIPAYIMFECGKKFLEAQGIYHISTIILLFAAPSNLVMNLLFVKTFGYIGIPIAISINYWLMTFGLFVSIIYFIKPHSTPSGKHPLTCWNGLHIKHSFQSWNKIVCLAVPGLVMLEAKFFALETLTLIASHLGTLSLAAQSVGTAIASLAYQVLIAIGIASSTRIANFLGAGSTSAAKKTTQVSLCFGLVFSIINLLFLYCFQTRIASLFTKDEKVIKTVESIMWLIALLQVFDAINAGSAGCLRGQGQTKIGGIVTLLSYYLVGIPLAIYITFYSKLKGTIDGLWIGNCVALIIIGVVQSYYALFADFITLCTDAQKRASN